MEETISAAVDEVGLCNIFHELRFSPALHDSVSDEDMVDRSIAGWVPSCTFLMYGIMIELYNWERRYRVSRKESINR